jgi:hypothetical protein
LNHQDIEARNIFGALAVSAAGYVKSAPDAAAQERKESLMNRQMAEEVKKIKTNTPADISQAHV